MISGLMSLNRLNDNYIGHHWYELSFWSMALTSASASPSAHVAVSAAVPINYDDTLAISWIWLMIVITTTVSHRSCCLWQMWSTEKRWLKNENKRMSLKAKEGEGVTEREKEKEELIKMAKIYDFSMCWWIGILQINW